MPKRRWPRKAKKWARRTPNVQLISVHGRRMRYSVTIRLPFRHNLYADE